MRRAAEAHASAGDVVPESATPSPSVGAFVGVDSAGVAAGSAVLSSSCRVQCYCRASMKPHRSLHE